MDIQKFQQKLTEGCELGEKNGKVLKPEQIKECFGELDLDKSQLIKILQYLKLKGISIEGAEEISAASQTGPEEVSEEKEEKVPLTAEEEAYLKEYLEGLEEQEQGERSAEELFELISKGDALAQAELSQKYLHAAAEMADYDESRMWYLFSGKEYIPTSLADEYMQAYEDFMADWEVPKGYTSEELYQEAADIEEKLKTLDIQRRQEQLALESMEKSATDGVVYAEVDGVVKTVGDPDEKPEQGQAFLVVTGDDGLYVKGTISELLLDDVPVGTVVSANSWESGMTFDATITEISDYPVSGNSWGEGNPNVSYYEYTAYIEDSSALRNGEAVDLSISTNQSDGGGIFIEKAYVRSEDGKSYCMIADENNRLKKQYVVTGRTVYGSAVEIKSGLTEDDQIGRAHV